jgi:hypothetical protein
MACPFPVVCLKERFFRRVIPFALPSFNSLGPGTSTYIKTSIYRFIFH